MCDKGDILVARTEAITENEMELVKREIFNIKQQLVFVKNTYIHMHKTVETLEENDFQSRSDLSSYNSNNYSNSYYNNISNYIQFEKDDSERSFDQKDDFIIKHVYQRNTQGIGYKMSLLSYKKKQRVTTYQISQPGDLFIERNMAFKRPTPSTSSVDLSSSSDTEYLYGNVYNKKRASKYRVNIENTLQIPIGLGNTMVPKEVFDEINWKSYTAATRKLLMAVFSRKVLATHSLSGKPSPAFADKPAKLRLNPLHVADIIYEVTERCNVKPNLVRIAITTKCGDENKMMKMKIMKRNAI